MRSCQVDLLVPCKIHFSFSDGEEETVRETLDDLVEGKPPPWLKEIILTSLESIDFKHIELNEVRFKGGIPTPDEELDFEC